ncbi:MAG: methylated-DNA--[protein]-cysteine S-methyltransferase [Desulfuromonadaceae bacterium]
MMKIAYSMVPNALGWVLVAATTRGICAVKLGDDPEQLLTKLQRRFPGTQISRDGQGLQSALQLLQNYLAGQDPPADLPLDEQGTPFQQRVWQELRRIPYGQTISYKELATRIGQPTAYRAVANACAQNPVAIFTPCHRVIRENGELGGYAGGVERKRLLLEKERGN